MKTLQFAVLPGDGIGPEVMDVALDVLQATGQRFGFALEYQTADTEIDIRFDSFRTRSVLDAFSRTDLAQKYEHNTLISMTIHLLLSMLPLHSDNASRQIAFYCMAHSLFEELG